MKVLLQVLKILTICLIFTQGILAGDAKVCLDHSKWLVQNRNTKTEWKEITTVDAARRWLSCFEPDVCDPYPGNNCNEYNNNNNNNNNNNDGSSKGSIGWRSKGTAGNGWCVGERPTDDWTLIGTCPNQKKSQVRVLTYNLFWWNLFG